MHIKCKSDKDKAVIYLSGELDECSAEKTRRELDEIISKNLGVKRIIFNFSEMNFMDSTGIGVLLGRYKNKLYVDYDYASEVVIGMPENAGEFEPVNIDEILG